MTDPILLAQRLSEIIAFLESCDSKEVIYTYHGLITQTVEIVSYNDSKLEEKNA